MLASLKISRTLFKISSRSQSSCVQESFSFYAGFEFLQSFLFQFHSFIGIVPSAPSLIDIPVAFMPINVFSSQARFKRLSSFFLYFHELLRQRCARFNPFVSSCSIHLALVFFSRLDDLFLHQNFRLLLLLLLSQYFLWASHITAIWWSFTGVWVIASFLKSSWLFPYSNWFW